MSLAQYALLAKKMSPDRTQRVSTTESTPSARKRRTQAERKEQAERRLLDAALTIVAERGSERLTLADVGEAAGYSRGLPMHYFGSKEGLLRALAIHSRERFRFERHAAVEAKPGLATILNTIDYYFSRRDPKWTATRAGLIMLTESLFEHSALGEAMRESNRMAITFIEAQIHEGIARNEIDARVHPREGATIILAAIRGVMLQWLNDPEIDLASVRRQLVTSIDKMLRAADAVTQAREAA